MGVLGEKFDLIAGADEAMDGGVVRRARINNETKYS